MLLSERDAKRLCQQLLGFVKADDAMVSVRSQTDHYLRFAANNFTTNGLQDDVKVGVIVWIDGKQGSVETNEIDNGSLASAVRQAEETARLSPADPEYLPTLGPQRYQPTRGYVEDTANISVTGRAKAIGGIISQCEKEGVVGAGLHRATGLAVCSATKNGNLWYERSSLASLLLSSRTREGDGSGFYMRGHHDVRKLDIERLARESIQKALASRNARNIDVGSYTVILEPQAVADLLMFLAYSFDARSAEEGRSAFSSSDGRTKVGEKLFDERISLFSDPWHPELPGSAATPIGLPAQKYYLVRNGVLENLTYSRFWAKRKEKTPSPGPVNMILQSSKPATSLQEMIASTDRGLLVSRFWYVRPVNQRALIQTGLTRDGVWYVESGKIQYPVRNLRFNQSILDTLAPGNIDLIGVPERVGNPEVQSSTWMLPALKVKQFRFTSQSDAV